MLNMRFTFATTESEAASSRTSEQKATRMAQARLNDGRVLGYENHGEVERRERRIHDGEAELVRRIFTMAADGLGILKIAKTLNDEYVVNPTGQARTMIDASTGLAITPKNAKALKTSWSQTSIRGILMNQLYIGVQFYGRTAGCWGDGECSRLGASFEVGRARGMPRSR